MIVTDLKANQSGIYTRDVGFQEKLAKTFGIRFSKDWAFTRPMILRKKILGAIKKSTS
jgi:hypothetical protein